jgi:phosphate transport system substrate-binding protein
VAFSYRTLLAIAATLTLSTLTLSLVAGCASSGGQAGGATGVNGAAGAGGSGSASTSIPAKPASAAITIKESGSTLLFPVFGAWASAYSQQFPHTATITTAATGSGKGIAAASDGTADIGASDAFLSSGNLVQNPNLLNIPLAISAQQVNYNLPKLGQGVHVRLDGAVLAEMYNGTITNWDDLAIRKINPGISLPNLPVRPLHRADSAGDTFLFSSYLSTDDPSWNSAIGYGTTVAWPPLSTAVAEMHNSGMVAGCKATPGCVAYIGISYLSKATAAGLGEAALANASGMYELPDAASMRAAVAQFVPATPANETISMVNGPAKYGYPIVNYEYAIVSRSQKDPVRALDLKAFLHWAITTGNASSFLDPVGFVRLPPPIVTLADDQITRIR